MGLGGTRPQGLGVISAALWGGKEISPVGVRPTSALSLSLGAPRPDLIPLGEPL